MELTPLVSVPVITYNSSNTVIETLESIKAQTYNNIELIISDDCSTDDTVEVCTKWVNENSDRFVRVVIIESPVNTGVSANMNRAEDACGGEWVKPIAGDDILEDLCIESYLDYVAENPESFFIFSKVKAFGASEETNKRFSEEVFDYSFITESNKNQIHRLIFERNYIPAATYFYNLEHARSIGIRNDERIPLLEDYPKWINMLKKGVRFAFLDKETVRYRISDSSLSTASSPSERFRKSNALFFIYYQFIPQFLAKPSSYLVVKSIMAHHLVDDKNLFWCLAYKAYAIYRRMACRNGELPCYF